LEEIYLDITKLFAEPINSLTLGGREMIDGYMIWGTYRSWYRCKYKCWRFLYFWAFGLDLL